MRLHAQGEGVDEGLEHIGRIHLLHAAADAFVAFGEAGDILLAVVFQTLAEDVVLYPLTPQLVQLALVGGPGAVLAVEGVVLVAGEIELRLIQQRKRVVHALLHLFAELAKDRERRLDAAVDQVVVEQLAVAFELAHILAGEEGTVGIEAVEVAVEGQCRQLIVDLRTLVVHRLERLRDH